MKAHQTDRGFVYIQHSIYANAKAEARLVGESSNVGDYKDSLENPGSSALWVGTSHHLNREEVADLIRRMQHWLDHKRLPLD